MPLDGLQFDPASHTYRLAGALLPHVTGVLQQLTDLSRVPPDVLERKRQLGTAVHLAIELDDRGSLDEDSVDAAIRPYLEAWRRFRRESGWRVLSIEERVCHPTLRFAGTLDRRMADTADRHTLVDAKATFALHPAIGPQTAAYALAWNAEHPKEPQLTRRAAVHLKPDGSYRLEPFNAPEDLSVFLAALSIFNWKQKHGLQ